MGMGSHIRMYVISETVVGLTIRYVAEAPSPVPFDARRQRQAWW